MIVDKVASMNVHLTIEQIIERSPILKAMVEEKKIVIAGGMYDVETRVVEFMD